MMSDSLSTLLDQIYDTVLDPVKWPDTLTLVSTFIGASFMSVVPYNDPASIFMSEGGGHAMRGYTEHWFKHDAMVKVGIKNKHKRDLICDWSAIGIEAIEKNVYYQEFRRDVRIGYCIGASFEAYPGDFRALGINLPLGRQPLGHSELETIDVILRHLARAITLCSRTQNLQVTLPGFSDILDRIQCGAAVVDVTGRVIVANRALRHLSGDGFNISSDKFQCTRTACQVGFERLINTTISTVSNKRNSDFTFIHRPSGGKPFMVRAVPLSQRSTEQIWGRLPQHRQALLLVVDLAAETTASCEQALKKLGLTSAEANVATLVGTGLSPRQAAARIGVTEGTVRNQLKQVFSKMDLRRQSDLVRTINQITQI